MLGGGIYPGMITATVGTAMLIAVVVTSVVIVRRRLRYEAWYAVHLLAYAGIALSWFHQIPTGNELVLDRAAADYWRALLPRDARAPGRLPAARAARAARSATGSASPRWSRKAPASSRSGSRDATSTACAPSRASSSSGASSTRGRWWARTRSRSPQAPDGRSLRITVKALGDFTARLRDVRAGTRVVAEGPFGVFTEAARRREKVLLIAGGIGITPIRSLVEEHARRRRRRLPRRRARRPRLPRRARRARARARHPRPLRRRRPPTGEGARLLSPEHLRELVPDVAERDVFLCGPPAMTDAISGTSGRRRSAPPRPHRTLRTLTRKELNHAKSIAAVLTPTTLAFPTPARRAATAPTRPTPKKKVVVTRTFTGAAACGRPLGRRPGHDRRQEDDHDTCDEEEDRQAEDRRR